MVFNETSTDTDFRIEGNGEANLFKVDAGNDRIGVGTATPSSLFHVAGVLECSNIKILGTNSFESSANVLEGKGSKGVRLRSALSAADTPSFSSKDDPDTGMFLPSSNIIGFTTGGTEKVRILSNGNLNIGTTNQHAKLTVQATSQVIGSEGTLKLQADASGADVGAGITFGNTNARRAAIIGNQEGTNAIAGYLAFGTRGTSGDIVERMRINASGLVRIGASGVGVSGLSPLLHLHKAASAATSYLHITNTDSGITNNDGFVLGFNGSNDALIFNKENTPLRFATNGTERMRIANDGKIAIGSTATDTGGVVIDKNITAESDASDTANYHLVIRSQTNSNTSKVGIAFKNSSGATSVGAAILHHRTGGVSVGDLAFYTSPTEGTTTERTKITSAGTLLHGSGAIATQKVTDGGLDVACNNLSLLFGADSNSGTNTQVRTNNAPKDQRIGAVHYTNAEEPVGVVRVYSDSTTNQLYWGGGSSIFNAATQQTFFTASTNTTTNGTERMRINSAGSVSMGTTTNANARLFVNPRVDGTTQRGIVVSGRKDVYDVIAINFVHATNNSSAGSITFTTTAAVAYNTTSDYRLKQDVVTLTDSITRLKLLNPVHFKWKDSPSVETDGFLAHEVQTVIPSAITGEKDALDKDGNIEPQQIDTSKLTPLLTSALQEAIAKIETLETKVAALEAA